MSIKWEKGGVSPSELIRQQTYARQDGAGNQPEVTLWQIYPEQEIMASDKKEMKADIVAAFGDCGDVVSSMPVSYTHLDVYKRQAWNRPVSIV